MRTTIDLPDRLLREAKAAAVFQGRTLKQFIIEAVQQRLHSGGGEPRRVILPLVPSRSPGHVMLTNEDIGRIADAEDAGLPP